MRKIRAIYTIVQGMVLIKNRKNWKMSKHLEKFHVMHLGFGLNDAQRQSSQHHALSVTDAQCHGTVRQSV